MATNKMIETDSDISAFIATKADVKAIFAGSAFHRVREKQSSISSTALPKGELSPRRTQMRIERDNRQQKAFGSFDQLFIINHLQAH
jgi:hypothetical protein